MSESIVPYGTPAQQLEEVNKAIYKILHGGQSYKIGSHSLTRADLGMLLSEKDKLEAQLRGNTGFLDGAYAADFGFDNRR